MEINKLEEYEDVKTLTNDIKQTLDNLAWKLQRRILEKTYHLSYRHSNHSYTEKDVELWKMEGRGIIESLEEINREFGTKYEADVKELDKYYKKPVQYK